MARLQTWRASRLIDHFSRESGVGREFVDEIFQSFAEKTGDPKTEKIKDALEEEGWSRDQLDDMPNSTLMGVARVNLGEDALREFDEDDDEVPDDDEASTKLADEMPKSEDEIDRMSPAAMKEKLKKFASRVRGYKERKKFADRLKTDDNRASPSDPDDEDKVRNYCERFSEHFAAAHQTPRDMVRAYRLASPAGKRAILEDLERAAGGALVV